MLRKIGPFLISFLVTLMVTLAIIMAKVNHPIGGTSALPLPGNSRLLILSLGLQVVTTYVFECAGRFSIRIWPLPVVDAWFEDG